ncbi:MAG TPA: SDR family oxidoreductase [Acidimicrobiales bacterium]|nr:SDR family oxidoreductase [Acidimicrobiales bacterium]
MTSLERVALVTGAGSGIGRAVASELGGEGFALVLVGRRRQALEETAEQVVAPGVQVVPTDVRDPAAVASLFGGTRARFGRLDLLFNNAGVGTPPIPIEDLTLDHWRAAVDTNLTGTFLCAQQAVRIMKDQSPQGGRIINNGSISAYAPRPNAAPYTATKHAVTGLTKAIALDGRRYNIACGQIDIGNAATELTARMGEGVLQPDGVRRPEPTMDVNEVARAVGYMASLPLDANVLFLTVMATKMPFVGRG